MTQIITECTGTVDVLENNTLRYLDENNQIATQQYGHDVQAIAVTDMDGEIWVYTAPVGFDLLVSTGDVVNRGAVLAELNN